MGTIKTTVKLETNSLPFPVNYTTSVTNTVVASNYARVIINDNAPTMLSNIQFGTEGGFLYAQAPTTNTFGTVVNIWLVDVNGDREIASLNPGEAILLPLSSSQQGIYATTNLGKIATLDYNVSDKGGSWGQSTLMLFNNNTNWEYTVIDVNTNQTPKIVDTSFSVSSWSLNNDWIVQDKGYILEFTSVATQINTKSEVKYLFIDSRGNIVENNIPLSVGTGANNISGKVWAKLYSVTGVAETCTIFDGDAIYTHSFEGADSIQIENNYDNTTADGSFIIYATNYNGTIYEEFVDSNFLINGGNKYLLASVNYGTGPTEHQYANSYVYQYANCVLIKTYDDQDEKDLSYKIFDTTGILLQDLDVSILNINDTALYFYGDNTFQLIASTISNGGRKYMFNYNHELNRLIGKNFEWSVSSSYDIHVSCYTKSLNNGFKEPYEPNGIAITFYNNDNYAGEAYLSQYTTDCKIYYLVEGMNTFSVYTPNKPIWFQRDMYTTRTNVFLVWGDNDGNATGPIKMLALNSSLYTNQNIDTNSVTLLADFQPVRSANWSVWRYPAGNEYLVHSFSQQDDTNNYTVIAKKGLVRTLTMVNAEWYWTSGFNAFAINMGSDNYGLTTFYYDFKQNTFVNVNGWYSIYTFPSDYGTYDINDVKNISSKIFLINENTNNARVLNGSTITPNKSLPYSGQSWDYYLGYDFIVWLDFQPSTQSCVIYIYDTDLKLISTYDTGYPNIANSWEVGSRIMLSLNDNDSHYLWVSKKGVVKITNTAYYRSIFNDFNWWNNW